MYGRTDTTRENNDHLIGRGLVGQKFHLKYDSLYSIISFVFISYNLIDTMKEVTRHPFILLLIHILVMSS